ncbi:MAG: helix-turn-helix domain-containing protein [Terriglobus sp.]
MARAKSAEKREAILRSAVREIAAVGLGASTAKIAAGAGLAEGTLFTYFATKDDLFNELYVALKMDAYQRIHDGFPLDGSLRERAEHIWTAYLQWAMEKPQDREVSVLLNLCSQVTAETRKQ